GLNATLVTSSPTWPLQETSSLPVALSQIFTVPLPEARRWPSGLNATPTPTTLSAVTSALPIPQSQILTGPAQAPEPRRWPSGLNATLVTVPVGWPLMENRSLLIRESRSLPIALSQIFTVLSPLPEATRSPSGLNATLVTKAAWPLRENSSMPVPLSQT